MSAQTVVSRLQKEGGTPPPNGDVMMYSAPYMEDMEDVQDVILRPEPCLGPVLALSVGARPQPGPTPGPDLESDQSLGASLDPEDS